MLAYAANAPRPAASRPAPNAMLFIIAGHVAVIAAVMSAKMDLPTRLFRPPTVVMTIPVPKAPDPTTQPQNQNQPANNSTIDRSNPFIPPTSSNPPVDDIGPTDPGPTIASNDFKLPPGPPFVAIDPPVKLGPRLLTPASQLKPPYPASKLLAEEEATLRLRLTIDERGRVIAVEPVGRADSVFLAAARRQLLGHWRYQPASEGGHAVSSSTVVTLRFQLDG